MTIACIRLRICESETEDYTNLEYNIIIWNPFDKFYGKHLMSNALSHHRIHVLTIVPTIK